MTTSSVETSAWQSAHYEEPFYSQRTAKLPGKLTRLGVLDLDPHSHILDTCCGKGEALALLHSRGFRCLAGADSTQHDSWGSIESCQFAVCDVRNMPFADEEFDAVINLHALHHMGDSSGVAAFLAEVHRVLKPGGKLFVLDFPASPQIKLLFRLLHRRIGVVTPGLRNFAEIVDEEWSYLFTYLRDWPAIEALLRDNALTVTRWQHRFFLYYLCLQKQGTTSSEPRPR